MTQSHARKLSLEVPAIERLFEEWHVFLNALNKKRFHGPISAMLNEKAGLAMLEQPDRLGLGLEPFIWHYPSAHLIQGLRDCLQACNAKSILGPTSVDFTRTEPDLYSVRLSFVHHDYHTFSWLAVFHINETVVLENGELVVRSR